MFSVLFNSVAASQLPGIVAHLQNQQLDLPALMTEAYSGQGLQSLRCIVPTGRAVRHLRKQCIRSIWHRFHKPTPPLRLGTLDTFIREEFQALRQDRQWRLMSDAFRFAMMREALQRCVHEERLIFYSRNRSPISLAVSQRLADIVYGLKRKGVSSDALREDLRLHETGTPNDKLFDYKRLYDVHQLYSAYEELRTADLLDMPSMNESLRKMRADKRSKQCAQTDLFDSQITAVQTQGLTLFDGFSEFTQPELDLLSDYAQGDEAIVITMSYEPENTELFGNLIEARAQLQAAGFMSRDFLDLQDDTSNIADQATEVPTLSRARKALQSTLFQPQTVKSSSDVELLQSLGKSVHVLSCDSRRDEMNSIAQYVKHCVHDRKIPLQDIVVLLRQPQNYASLLREIFEAQGVPINMSDRASLATSPVIAGIFAMINVVCGDYRRSDLLRALSSPVIHINHQSRSFDSDMFENIARMLRIEGGARNGGLKGWMQRLDQALHAAQAQLGYHEAARTDEAEEAELKALQRKIDEMMDVSRSLQFFQQNMPHRDKLCTPQEFHHIILEAFIEKLGVEDQLNKDALEVYHLQADEAELLRRRELVEQSTRSLGTFISLLDELEFVMRERAQQPMRFRDYAEILESSVRAARVQIRERGNFGLDITSIEQTRGIPYRIVILAGMLDLEFPLGYSPEYFLGKELPDSELRHIRAERSSFYHALANPLAALCKGDGELLITYARQGARDEERIASPFLQEVRELFGAPLSAGSAAKTSQDLKSSILRKSLNKQRLAQDLNPAFLADNGQVSGAIQRGPADHGSQDNTEDTGNISSSELSFYAPWLDAIGSEDELWQFADMRSTWMPFFASQSQSDNLRFVADIVQSFQREHAAQADIASHLSSQELEHLAAILDRPVSASEIELYAACPYKYFASKILALPEEQRESTVLDPMERGNALHHIVYLFYTALATEQRIYERIEEAQSNPSIRISGVRLDASKREQYLTMLLDIARKELDRLRYDHSFFQINEDEVLGMAGRPGLLHHWLDAELSRVTAWQFTPLLFEWGFGMPARERRGEAVRIAEISLRGKVDRVEIRSTDSGDYEFMVADYKSSDKGTSTNKMIQEGESFQLPLYLVAVEQLLREQLGIQAKSAGAVYYIFKQLNDPFKLVLLEEDSHLVGAKKNDSFVTKASTTSVLKSPVTRDEILQDVVARTRDIEHHIAAADFPVQPLNKQSCSYCAFKRLCRVRECGNVLPEAESEAES